MKETVLCISEEDGVPEDPILPEGDYFSVELERAPHPLSVGIGLIRSKKDSFIRVRDVKENSPAAEHKEIRVGK